MASESDDKKIGEFVAALVGMDILLYGDPYPEGLTHSALFDMFSVVCELEPKIRNAFKNDFKAKDESALHHRNVPEIGLIGNFAQKQEERHRPVLDNFDHIVYLVEFAKKLINSGKLNQLSAHLNMPLTS